MVPCLPCFPGRAVTIGFRGIMVTSGLVDHLNLNKLSHYDLQRSGLGFWFCLRTILTLLFLDCGLLSYILSCVVKRLRKLIHAACSSSRICTSQGSQFERSGTRSGMPTFRSGGVLGLSSNHLSSLGIPARPTYIYIYAIDSPSLSTNGDSTRELHPFQMQQIRLLSSLIIQPAAAGAGATNPRLLSVWTVYLVSNQPPAVGHWFLVLKS